MEIVWSPRSLEKLEQIGDYIALDAPERAEVFVRQLVESVDRLKSFPMSGQITKENPAFRHIVLQGYRLVYRVLELHIEIVAIVSPRENNENTIDNNEGSDE